MKRLGTIGIVLLIILPLDVGVAQFCRANCDFWKNTYPRGDHRVRSEDYHHGLAPRRRVTEAWGLSRYFYATNSLGFKDSEPRTIDPKGGGTRVLFLGDSFTEGKGFAFPETFVGRVAREMSKRGIEVLNGGVDSYSPAIYRHKVKYLLETVGLRFDALVVFLDVSDILNEARDYPLDSEGRLIVPLEEKEPLLDSLRFLRDNSAAARLISVAYDHLSLIVRIAWARVKISRSWGKPLFAVENMDFWIYATTQHKGSAWTFDETLWRDYGATGRQRAAVQMDALFSMLQDRGIPLVLAVYPWPDQLFHDPQAPRHQGFWRRWSEDRGVPFISLFPAFTEGKPRDVLQRYFIPFDHHWNAEGHKLVARKFLEQFRPPSSPAQ